jgi:hypothetical protein
VNDLCSEGSVSAGPRSSPSEVIPAVASAGNIAVDETFPVSGAPGRRSVRAVALREIRPFDELVMEV